jgi:hypothetical protein
MESQKPVTAASGRTVTTHSGGGLTIIPQFDSSVTDLNGDGNPNDQAIYNGYTSAVETAIKYYENIITNPITITIDFGYGEVGGNQGNPGSPMTDGGGESTFSLYGYNYGDVRDAVIANANTTQSPVQLAAAAALPTTDPDNTTVDNQSDGDLWISPANALALGVSASPPGTDGSIGNVGIGSFPSGSEFGWAWSQSTVSGTDFDAVATLEHEITEVMGREDFVGTDEDSYSLLDMYRYSAADNAASASPGSAVGQFEQPFEAGYNSNVQTYFSYDGKTVTLPYDTPTQIANGLDAGDWEYVDNQGTYDPYDGFSVNGLVGQISPTDLQELQTIGWNIPSAACYCAGTLIKTDRGEAAIETLRIGDQVMTMSGEMHPIRWIGRRSYRRSQVQDNRDLMPIRFRAGALGEGVPHRDLWVSPDHAMWIEGLLIPARLIVNGLSILQDETVGEVNYFHLELAAHDVIFAEGALSETFVDDGSRQRFDNAAEYYRLYPDAGGEPARFCAPRVEDGYALEAVRRGLQSDAYEHLAARSVSIGMPRLLTQAAGSLGVAD